MKDSGPPPTLVVDFDGTLARVDIGDALCDTFADPNWRLAAEAWRRGDLSLPDAQRIMWSTVRVSREELLARAMEVGELREGADALFEAAERGLIRLVIASGGFGLYIEALLGEARLKLLSAAYYNHLECARDGARVSFPHAELADGPYAICKARVVRKHRAAAFCGDGSSDRSVMGAVPMLFAVRGSLLDRYCNEHSARCVSVDDFHQVLAAMAREHGSPSQTSR